MGYADDVLACLKDKQYDLVFEHLKDFKKRFTKVCVKNISINLTLYFRIKKEYVQF